MPRQSEVRSMDTARAAPAQAANNISTAATVLRIDPPQLEAYVRHHQPHDRVALGVPSNREDMADYIKRWEEWYERASKSATDFDQIQFRAAFID
ncbi:MAG: hypothetical protein M1835_006524 [Candelina submexicana]|nr:MAG: hypothetical protein M1835_006524 [Candelina submexicana]